LPRYAAVVFDMDDTVISRADAFQRYLERFYREHEALHGTPIQPALDLMTQWDCRGDNDKIEYFGKVKAEWPGLEETIDVLIDQFWGLLAEEVEPDHSSNEVLGQLNQAGVPWGIVTNGQSKMQRRKTVRAGLIPLAPFILVPSEFGDQKPSPAVFIKAVEETGSFASETLFVGDNPVTDIRGAQSIGMPTAWMKAGRTEWDGGTPEPDHQIDHIRELLPFLIK